MPGTASSDFGNWLDALAEHVTIATEVIMAPLEEIHQFKKTGAGQDAVIFPFVTSSLTFAGVTQGTEYSTTTGFPIEGTTLTPIPYEAQILVPEQAVAQNPSNYLQVVSQEMAAGVHKQLMSLLVAVYDDFIDSANATGTNAVVTGFRSSLSNLEASGNRGPFFANLNPKQIGDLETDLIANYGNVGLASSVVNGLAKYPMFDALILKDSEVDLVDAMHRGFLGTKDAIGVALGWDSGIKMLQATDATHIKLARSYWVAVGAISTNKGRHYKTL